MRVIIAGGRDFNDYKLLKFKTAEILLNEVIEDKINVTMEDCEIVCGKARGADTLGEKYAIELGLKIKYFIPDWDGLGKRAGYIRNADMAIYAKDDNGVLIAFWDGKSKGTKHMIDLAYKHGLKVFVINY